MRELVSGEFNLPIIEKSIARIGTKKVARILVSITGDMLPDGTPDVDLDGQITDFEASCECAKAWDGVVKFHHIDDSHGKVGQAVSCIVRRDEREIFGDFQIDHPIAVRMIEAEVPFEASWRGEYYKVPEAVKSSDGKSVMAERIFPVSWKEVSIVPAINGAARPRSVALATATKSADGGPKKENMPMAEDSNMAAPPGGEPAADSPAAPSNKGLAKSQKALQGAIDALSEEMGAHPVLGSVYQPIVDELKEALDVLSGKAPATAEPEMEPMEGGSPLDVSADTAKSKGAQIAPKATPRHDPSPEILEAVKGMDRKYDAVLAAIAAQGEVINKIASTPQAADVAVTRGVAGTHGDAAKGKASADEIVRVAKELAAKDPARSREILDAAWVMSHAAESGRS